MKGRKTRKYLKTNKNNLEEMIEKDKKEIEKLTEKSNDLCRKIKKDGSQLVKAKFVRNLKIFGSLLSFISPFCIVGTIVTGSFYVLDAGLPFIKDKEKNYKKYSYESINGIVTLEESYDGGVGHKINYGTTIFDVYSPWIENSAGYERRIRHYKEDNLTDVNLYKALMDNNIDYIYSNYNYIDEEIEYSNNLSNEKLDGTFIISGVLDCIDKNDYILTTESDTENNVTTTCDLCLTLLSSAFWIKLRKYKLKTKIKLYMSEYDNRKKKFESNKEDLEHIQNKIKALSKWVDKHEK